MDFKSIIRSQEEDFGEKEERERLIPREPAQTASAAIARPNILAIVGVRRSGKSVFARQLTKRFVSGRIDFDDERLMGTRTGDLDRILQALYELHGNLECVVLDEVQQVPGWELFASRLRNRMRVTGSNAHLLGGELATHLTGRYIDSVLFPFSFREYLSCKQIPSSANPTTRERAGIVKALGEYMQSGGFPEVRMVGKAIVPRIFGDIIQKDIVKRHNIRSGEALHAMARFLVENASSEITLKRLAPTLGLKSLHTASKWMSYFRQAFLLFELERFSYKLRERHLAPRKVFCIDSGIVTSVSSGFSVNVGRLMENVVAVELRRRCALEWGAEVFYWKDHQQNEVDFVEKRGRKVSGLIQVTYASDRKDLRGRELTSLLKASTDLNCRDLKILTWDLEGEERSGGRKVRFLPLWKWLLEPVKNQSKPT